MRGLFAGCLSAFCLCLFAGIETVSAPPAVTSRVVVTSQPVGATVIVDGRDRGVTPLTLFNLTPGPHHLRYRMAGYVERDRFFTTDEGPVLEKNEVLVEETGLLLLKTEPAGANVEIDGVSFGQTPKLVTTLPVNGSYTVTFAKTGYQPLKIAVKFNGREPQVREEKLVLDSGTLNVVTEPAGAEVTVNGLVRGMAPTVVRDVPKGRASVRVRLQGYKEERRDLALKAGDEQTLELKLTPLPGKLFLTSEPEGAKFYLNDEVRGTGPLTLSDVAPGTYAVRAEKEGFGPLERQVTVGNGASVREEFKLSNVMGRIELRTEPAGATVVLDGKILGETKAREGAETSDTFAIENVLEGEHTLIVRLHGYQEVTRHPKVRSTKTSQANVRLKRLFTPNVEVETIRGTYTGVLVKNSADSVELEVKLGVTQSFPRAEIRKIRFIDLPGEKASK